MSDEVDSSRALVIRDGHDSARGIAIRQAAEL